MPDTYAASNFIGLPLIANMDGVKIYSNLISGESAFIGTFKKGDNMGKVSSYIAKGKGKYSTYLEDGFEVFGNLPSGGRGTFYVPIRKGYFDKQAELALGLLSDQQIVEIQKQKETAALGTVGQLQAKINSLGTLVEHVALYGILAVVAYGAFQIVKLIRGK